MLKIINEKIVRGIRRVPRVIWVAVILTLLFRITGLWWVLSHQGIDVLTAGDGLGYIELARHLTEGRGFVFYGEGQFLTETFRTPGLPLLLAPFVHSVLGLKVYLFLQTIIAGIFLPILLWLVGKRTFGEKAGIIAAWCGALELQMIFFSWYTYTEMPFIIISLVSLLFFLKAWQEISWRSAVLAGLFAGYAVLIRPGTLILFVIALGGSLVVAGIRHLAPVKVILLGLAVIFLTLTPWYIRTYRVTGVVALGGAGWRNVYTDYLASIRAVKSGNDFFSEKRKLKEEASQFGLNRLDINSPANAKTLRNVALKEIMANPKTVIKLETMLMVTFFTNDNYYLASSHLGFLPHLTNRISPTQTLLMKGIGGIGEVFRELQRQFFLPIIGRLLMLAMLGLAAVGWFRSGLPIRWIFLAIIVVAAITSSVIGFGLEARLRLPVAPLIFLLIGAAFQKRLTTSLTKVL